MEYADSPFNNLVALGRQLRRDGYRFVTPTPATHARVLKRNGTAPWGLGDIFGWNRSCPPGSLLLAYRGFLNDPDLFHQENNGNVRAKVRFSTLGDLLIAHSAFPTIARDAVFFGPDTYRFCRAIAAIRESSFRPERVLDIGAGPGTGGLFAAKLFPSLSDIVLADVNPLALRFAAANAALNDLPSAQTCLSDVLDGVLGNADLIISNPPYLVDPEHRTYRDGGGNWGHALAQRILEQALPRLARNGHLILYTGSPVVDGQDTFRKAIEPLLGRNTRNYQYEEIDPDVFGEELEKAPYDCADRIASVVLHVRGEELLR